jgi:hypothetical protein
MPTWLAPMSLPLDRTLRTPRTRSLHFVHDAGKWKTPESRKDLKGKGSIILDWDVQI